MLTVLHTESSKGWGGQENRILREAIGLRDRGVRTLLLCQPGSMLGKIAAEEGFEVMRCRMRKSYDLPALRYIIRLIKEEKIDVVSTHSGRDSFLAGLAGRMSRRRPVIVRTRHLALPITSRMTYSLLPHRVVAVSEFVRQYLIKAKVDDVKVVAIPTGIDLSRFDPEEIEGRLREELGIRPDIPLVGTVGILRVKKGHHILLDAIPLVLKAVPEAAFVFAGDGPQRKNISDKIEALGLSGKVIMLGLRRDVPDILKSVDLFVLPTLQEALGTSFLEAMAMERPVIGTDVDGVSEAVRDGVNGRLVEPNNPGALADAILGLLDDKEKAVMMGREGRKMVEQHFTAEKMCERMYELYMSLLEKGDR